MRKHPPLLAFFCIILLTVVFIPTIVKSVEPLHFCPLDPNVREGDFFNIGIARSPLCKYPVSNCTVRMSLNGMLIQASITDESGYVTFQAPAVEQDTYITITAIDPELNESIIEGDEGSSISIDILVLDNLDMLYLTAPAVSNEAEIIRTLVILNDHPCKDAQVWGDWDPDTKYYTDANGTAYVTVPSVSQDTYYWIHAFKSPYTGDSSLILIKNEASPPPPPPPTQLIISTPDTIYELQAFDVNITADNSPVSIVNVTFAGTTVLTNSNGTAHFTAPEVNHHTNFSITASKEGYEPATDSITVYNRGQTPTNPDEYGWIVGIVTNASQQPLEDVTVCAIIGTIYSNCITTNEHGAYNITVSPGRYLVKASKEGYVTKYVDNIIVQKDIATQINFTLDEEGKQQVNSLIEYAISAEVANGNVLSQISITSNNGGVSTAITTHFSNSNVMVESITDTQFKFTVSGTHDLNGKLLVFEIEQSNLKNIKVLWDNVEATEITFGQMFTENDENPSDTPSVTWTTVSAENTQGINVDYVIIKGEYSTHSLEIVLLSPLIPGEGTIQFRELTIVAGIAVIGLAALVMFRKGKER